MTVSDRAHRTTTTTYRRRARSPGLDEPAFLHIGERDVVLQSPHRLTPGSAGSSSKAASPIQIRRPSPSSVM